MAGSRKRKLDNLNVLNQQQKVFHYQTQYATDRYKFVNNILTLKQAAGTLSFEDLHALNAWLIDTRKEKTLHRNLHKRKKKH